jgi:hypothetical protein
MVESIVLAVMLVLLSIAMFLFGWIMGDRYRRSVKRG